MPLPIKIIVEDTILQAEIFDTLCGKEIYSCLPIEARPNIWGDEFYFTIPVTMPLDETATTSVNVGDIGYWPPGHAITIFFGPTPLSTTDEPVPASAVNLVGRITDDPKVLKRKKSNTKIRIEKIL